VVGLPRPPKTRKRKRAALIVNMHPSQLASLERRAVRASMTLAEFVSALLFGDEETADACPHGVALEAVGAGACVRCDRSGRPKVEALDTHEHTHGTRPSDRTRLEWGS